MALTEAQVVAAEMERVDPTVAVLFDRDSLFYAQVEKGEVEVTSLRDLRVPLETRTGGNFGGWSPEGGDLGRGDAPIYDVGTINPVYMRHAIEWNKITEWVTDDKRKAVINAFQRTLASAMPEFRRHVDSQCMTDGTGVLATVSAVDPNVGGTTDHVTCGTDGFGVRLIRDRQTINYYDAALAVNRTVGAEKLISFYDLVNKIIYTPTTANLAPGDKVVVGGVSATPPVWLKGVPYHHNDASTGNWLGIDRATHPEVRANRVVANAGFSLPFARLAMNKVGDRVGQDNQYKVEAWMHPCQKQAYEEIAQLMSVINKDAKSMGVDLYFNDNMQMAGAPVRTSFSWDKTRIDFICKQIWKRGELHPAGFYKSSDGRRMFEIRGASGGVAAADIFYLCAAFNLYVTNPAVCAYISNLTVTSGY